MTSKKHNSALTAMSTTKSNDKEKDECKSRDDNETFGGQQTLVQLVANISIIQT